MSFLPNTRGQSIHRNRSFANLLAMVAVVAAMTPLISGCSGGPDSAGGGGTAGSGGMSGAGNTGGGGITCDAPTIVFIPSCSSGAVCHGPSELFPPNLALADPTPGLVGVKSKSIAPCTNLPIVNAADPATSVLLTRINGTACGEQMPSQLDGAQPPLTADEMACVTSWVLSKKQ